jgi:UDP-N-acetylglucosamine/UDP-N-acetylgalactosamine diphosphorylase
VKFFEENVFFGLSPSQVFFIMQENLPFLDNHGDWMLEHPGKIAEGPDGNGHALRLFFSSGVWEKWKQGGIEFLNVIFVDNALADPFDLEFAGFAARNQSDVALKAVERLSPEEKMGVLIESEGKLKVIEYTELPSGVSAFPFSSPGMFCFSMQFIAHLFQQMNVELPLHLARKKALVLLGTAKGFVQEIAHVWKCERFIFDFLDYARKTAVVVYPREKIYAPLKNAIGEKSVDSVKRALLLHDREIFQTLTGRMPPAASFELDPAFYYATEPLRERLLTVPLSDQDYISSV